MYIGLDFFGNYFYTACIDNVVGSSQPLEMAWIFNFNKVIGYNFFSQVRGINFETPPFISAYFYTWQNSKIFRSKGSVEGLQCNVRNRFSHAIGGINTTA